MWSRVVIFGHIMNSIGFVIFNETWEHYSKTEGIELQFNSMYYLDNHEDSWMNAKNPWSGDEVPETGTSQEWIICSTVVPCPSDA